MQRGQILLEEYRQLNENMRHYANMRFKQLTLFYVMNGALVTGFIATVTTGAGIPQWAFKGLGIILVVLFAVIGERISDYWHAFRYRARKIESTLGLWQHRDAPIEKYLGARNATRGLYVAFLVFWALLLSKGWGVLIVLLFVGFLVYRYRSVKRRCPID